MRSFVRRSQERRKKAKRPRLVVCTCRRRRCVNVRLSLTKLWIPSTASKTAEPDRDGRTERLRPVAKHTNALTYGNVIKALHLIAPLGYPSDAKSKPQFDFDEISKATRNAGQHDYSLTDIIFLSISPAGVYVSTR